MLGPGASDHDRTRSSSRATGVLPGLKAEIKATVYLAPKSEGATAGATPQGPRHDGRPATSAAAARTPTPPTAAALREPHEALPFDLWHDLREKRLWPVAALLLLALVAVPVLLAKPAEDAGDAAAVAVDVPNVAGSEIAQLAEVEG